MGELVPSETEAGKESVVSRMAVIFLNDVLSGKMQTQYLCECELTGMKEYAHWFMSTNSRIRMVIALQLIHELKASN